MATSTLRITRNRSDLPLYSTAVISGPTHTAVQCTVQPLAPPSAAIVGRQWHTALTTGIYELRMSHLSTMHQSETSTMHHKPSQCVPPALSRRAPLRPRKNVTPMKGMSPVAFYHAESSHMLHRCLYFSPLLFPLGFGALPSGLVPCLVPRGVWPRGACPLFDCCPPLLLRLLSLETSSVAPRIS